MGASEVISVALRRYLEGELAERGPKTSANAWPESCRVLGWSSPRSRGAGGSLGTGISPWRLLRADELQIAAGILKGHSSSSWGRRAEGEGMLRDLQRKAGASPPTDEDTGARGAARLCCSQRTHARPRPSAQARARSSPQHHQMAPSTPPAPCSAQTPSCVLGVGGTALFPRAPIPVALLCTDFPLLCDVMEGCKVLSG